MIWERISGFKPTANSARHKGGPVQTISAHGDPTADAGVTRSNISTKLSSMFRCILDGLAVYGMCFYGYPEYESDLEEVGSQTRTRDETGSGACGELTRRAD